MAFYVYAWRDVRDAAQGNTVTGTQNARRVESTQKTIVISKGSAPVAGDLEVPIKDNFSEMPAADITAMATAAAAANANGTVRVNTTTTVDGFRFGKSFYQFGVGYHASSETNAANAIVWKNI